MNKMIALGVAGALIYIAATGTVTKNSTVNTALIAIGAVSLAKLTPVVNQYVA